jgi:hypothetical protein
MIYQILGIILQVAGFVFACRLGARLCDRLSKQCKWAPLAVAGPLLVAMLVVVFVCHPPLTFFIQTAGLWLVAFAGGIAVRAKSYFENNNNKG